MSDDDDNAGAPGTDTGLAADPDPDAPPLRARLEALLLVVDQPTP